MFCKRKADNIMMKKIISLLLIVLILLSFFSGCNDEENPENTTKAQSADTLDNTIVLPYITSDAINPYMCETNENMNISALIFESLFTINSDFSVKPVLAKSYKTEGLLVKVTINSDIRFSDNSLLTTADVVTSFEKAKASSQYAQSLTNFESAIATDSTTVAFTMKSLKQNPALCLDFPIVRESETGVIGTGVYMIKDSFLEVNEYSSSASAVRNKKIKLKELPKGEGLYYGVEVGSISAYYDDLSSGSVTPATTQTVSVATNNLIYLGFNASENEPLSDKEVRKAVSLAINRENIVTSCFQTHAQPSAYPFNPSWANAPDTANDMLSSDLQKAENILRNAKYEKNYLGIYYKDSSVLDLTLVVNSENGFKKAVAKAISTELKKIGMNVNVVETDSASVMSIIESKNFDMYIGEIKQTNDMSLSPFFSESNNASKGIDADSSVAKMYSNYENGLKTLNDFIKVYNDEMPFAAICYRKGILYCTKELADNVNGTYKSVYSNINSWHFNKSY